MILRIVTSAELVNDDGTVMEPRNGFKVGSTCMLGSIDNMNVDALDQVAARLLSEITVEAMVQVNTRWMEKDLSNVS